MHCYIIIRKEEWKKEKPACALLYNYKKGRKEERKPACALLYNYKKGRMEERETSMCIVI